MTVADIIERLGGATAAAQALRLNRTAVLQWRARGQVPPRHVPAVAKALGVPAEAVWPDLAPQPRQEAA
jgi:DNA-binding transcriptional regulator YdaS (Cro superfamily)